VRWSWAAGPVDTQALQWPRRRSRCAAGPVTVFLAFLKVRAGHGLIPVKDARPQTTFCKRSIRHNRRRDPPRKVLRSRLDGACSIVIRSEKDSGRKFAPGDDRQDAAVRTSASQRQHRLMPSPSLNATRRRSVSARSPDIQSSTRRACNVEVGLTFAVTGSLVGGILIPRV
jgi:hypothetical protein